MNIYISCDMEGTAGVCSWKQCDPSDAHEYPLFRRYMTGEVRAAIEGAREGGAREIVVNDSHWSMRNLLLDELPGDDDLRVISGAPKPWSMMQGFDAPADAVFSPATTPRRAIARRSRTRLADRSTPSRSTAFRAARHCSMPRWPEVTAFRSCSSPAIASSSRRLRVRCRGRSGLPLKTLSGSRR